ncbi:tRNA/rRNA methyltransferase [Aliiruegeria haliotis]|uniref:tRNA/rRNA methyltransferase n=1 Tax=Aliiruegeria haliotis TaxID=1280846 RepID=A0A2T0RT08_9RHOB|nr:RNA methyltransferase [Aliiruegeria haliotis]PRY24326.1 tRNA/rRNA methyltransferase [Aliiruegeria haliotis]
MQQPAFILVRSQMGENIGGAARAMWNFGLDRMRLVDPRDGWPNPRAVALASGAGRLLDEAGLYETVPDAIADCTHVYATTARVRGLTKPVLTPEQAMAEARAVTEAGGRVGILFGPERAGLENEDVSRAHAIITVPVNPEFFSLNLAQCVLLTAYEWQRQTMDPIEAPEIERATAIEVEALGNHFEQRLDAAGFFFPPTKAPHMKLAVRNMLSRLALTRSDVQTFHGMLRQLTRTVTAPGSSTSGAPDQPPEE